jgi:galactokinase
MAVKHPGALKKLMIVLALMKKEPVGSTYNLKAEEVMKRSEILESKLSTKTFSELSKESIVVGC